MISFKKKHKNLKNYIKEMLFWNDFKLGENNIFKKLTLSKS